MHVSSHPGQLSLAIPLCVGAVSSRLWAMGWRPYVAGRGKQTAKISTSGIAVISMLHGSSSQCIMGGFLCNN